MSSAAVMPAVYEFVGAANDLLPLVRPTNVKEQACPPHPSTLQSISELAADQLLKPTPGNEPRLQLTNAGRELHRQIRSAVNQTINQLYHDIPADDLAIAGRVLVLLTARAGAARANAEVTRI